MEDLKKNQNNFKKIRFFFVFEDLKILKNLLNNQKTNFRIGCKSHNL